MKLVLSLSLVLALGAGGCVGDDSDPVDAAAGTDATVSRDAAAPIDATVARDAATVDSGVSDSGVSDSGAVAPDADPVFADAEQPDADPTPADAAAPDAMAVTPDATAPDAETGFADAAAPDAVVIADSGLTFPDASGQPDAEPSLDAEPAADAEPEDAGPGPAVTFTQVYAQVIQANCSCHTLGASGGLQMGSANSAYANLVNVTSAGYAPAIRVVPGAAARSLLFDKVTGNRFGNQMPLGNPALSGAQVSLIQQWIDGGAVR